MSTTEKLSDNQLLQAVVAFIQAEDEAARRVLEEQRSLLLTTDAREMLAMFQRQAAEQGDQAVQERLQERLALWQQMRFGAQTEPTPSPQMDADTPMHLMNTPHDGETGIDGASTDGTSIDPTERTYTVITAVNSAIGDNASVLNIFNIGELPLCWRIPHESSPLQESRTAVGRQQELCVLHERLTHHHEAAIIGVGAMSGSETDLGPATGLGAAIRGQAGIGKTVLADMYVRSYGEHYAGGTLWLTVGPRVRTADGLQPLLQRIATYAYDANPQAQQMLQNTVFSPAVVRQLLQRHRTQGPLLVVADDVWHEAVVAGLKAALPDESVLILTTRDYDVAFALGESDGAIQTLDVLTPDDARTLLQTRVSGLSVALADQLAKGLGYHAQALVLAAGALSRRKRHRYAQTTAEILARVAEGRGFGDQPRADKVNVPTPVEIALAYSYDYLGEVSVADLGNADGSIGERMSTDTTNPLSVENKTATPSTKSPRKPPSVLPKSATLQPCFRALGVFAQEADFDTEAVATLWGCSTDEAEELLLLLDGLALIQEVQVASDSIQSALEVAGGELQGARWEQHTILRAYALSLQAAEEQLAWAERHADHYLALTQRCRAAKPHQDDRVETEFAQIEHAFDWCQRESPIRAVILREFLDDFMRNRGRIQQLHDWLQKTLIAAQHIGDRQGYATTLRSLGDLERHLGNVEAARGHYEDALPLYEAEQDRLGKANILKGLGDLERRLGNVEAASGHYEDALPLYEAEQDRLGKADTLVSLGDLEKHLGNVDAARDYYGFAMPLYEAEQDRMGKANTLISLGKLESFLGNMHSARCLYQDALPLYVAEQTRLGKAITLRSLGDLESRLGNVDTARGHYLDALPLYEDERDRLGKANTLISLGDLERHLGNVEATRCHYLEVLRLYESEQHRLGIANTLISLGDLERHIGNVGVARCHYLDTILLCEALQHRLGKANTLKSLGDLEGLLGNVEAARGHYENALPLYEVLQDKLGKANILRSLGDLERHLGNRGAARVHYEDAMSLYEVLQNRLGKANVLIGMGDGEKCIGNVEAARIHYEDALHLYEDEQDRLGKANTLVSLGSLESDLGNVDAARGYYEDALPLYEALQDRLGKANTLISLGKLESDLGNVDVARGYYMDALPLYEVQQNRLGKANTLKSLGDLESYLGNVDAAGCHYLDTISLYEAEQDRLGKASTLKSLGDLESYLGNVNAARQLYAEAESLYDLEQDARGQIDVDISQAYLAVRQDDFSQALSYFEQALVRADAINFGDHPIVQAWRQEYAAIKTTHKHEVTLAHLQKLQPEMTEDSTRHAITALASVDSNEPLAAILDTHPQLQELPALTILAGMLVQAGQTQDVYAIVRLLVLLLTLIDFYHQKHHKEIEVDAHTQFISLCEQLMPVTEAVDNALENTPDSTMKLTPALHKITSWALNTLGNHYATTDDSAQSDTVQGTNKTGARPDYTAAIDAYTRAIVHQAANAPDHGQVNAMLYRNRAGVHIEMGNLDAAQADIDTATQLEPDAERLIELREELETARNVT
ncbi:MAG: tetratricopeptide repeat protein [Chloroflexota bacterium]